MIKLIVDVDSDSVLDVNGPLGDDITMSDMREVGDVKIVNALLKKGWRFKGLIVAENSAGWKYKEIWMSNLEDLPTEAQNTNA